MKFTDKDFRVKKIGEWEWGYFCWICGEGPSYPTPVRCNKCGEDDFVSRDYRVASGRAKGDPWWKKMFFREKRVHLYGGEVIGPKEKNDE